MVEHVPSGPHRSLSRFNNCHHWFGAVPGLPDQGKKDLWLQYIATDATLLKQILPNGVRSAASGESRTKLAVFIDSHEQCFVN